MIGGLTEILILCGIGAFFLTLFLFAFIPYVLELSEGIRYFKMEIKRSTNENMRKFWKAKLRKYIFNKIPIVRLFIKV